MLLKTKFLSPPYNEKSVARPRLLEKLTFRSGRKLTIITAAAGYGKTTLVSQWLQHAQTPYSWLSLDENDNIASRFWEYITGALQQNFPQLFEEARFFIQQDQTNLEAAITALVNDLSTVQLEQNQKHVLILDDFHVIDDPEIFRQFAYLVDFLPHQIEIIATSRTIPPLPISRWKVKNFVDQIYAADLVFSLEESHAFFRDYMDLNLSKHQIEKICRQTEGWAAAMQLTAIGVSHFPASEQKMLSYEGLLADDQHFSEYVLEEILGRQSDELNTFLLETSCLHRINPALCDAVTERDNSRNLLDQLEKSNLFLIPLDNQHTWYRYHELFRNALFKQYCRSHQDRVEDIQRKAISWLVDQDEKMEAIEQVILLKDWDLLIDLLMEHGNTLIHEGHHLPVLNWLALAPNHKIDNSPRILMLKIWALYFSNKIEVIPPLLDDLENLIDYQRLKDVPTETDELIDLHSEISLIRSYLARSKSDINSATALTRKVLEDLDNTNMPLKSVTYYGIGLDSFTKGDLESACLSLEAAIKYGKIEKRYTTVLSSSGLLAWIRFYQGELDLAKEVGIVNQQWIDSYHDPSQPRIISCWQNCALALVFNEKGETTIAESYINPLLKHLVEGTEPGQHILIQYARASILFSAKRYAETIDCLEDAIDVFQHKKESVVFSPPNMSALKARCLLLTGEVEKAQQIVDSLELHEDMTAQLNVEDKILTQARIYNAQAKYQESVELLEQLLKDTAEASHSLHLIQGLTIKAIALRLIGDIDRATKNINRALLLGTQDGYINVFVNEGPLVRDTIGLATDPGIPHSYLERLNTLLEIKVNTEPKTKTVAKIPSQKISQPLIEPLSQRELEVLGLIDEGLANKEIARKLDLAPATIKAHIRNLYGKIEAKSRTEALAKARNLGIL